MAEFEKTFGLRNIQWACASGGLSHVLRGNNYRRGHRSGSSQEGGTLYGMNGRMSSIDQEQVHVYFDYGIMLNTRIYCLSLTIDEMFK